MAFLRFLREIKLKFVKLSDLSINETKTFSNPVCIWNGDYSNKQSKKVKYQAIIFRLVFGGVISFTISR